MRKFLITMALLFVTCACFAGYDGSYYQFILTDKNPTYKISEVIPQWSIAGESEMSYTVTVNYTPYYIGADTAIHVLLSTKNYIPFDDASKEGVYTFDKGRKMFTFFMGPYVKKQHDSTFILNISRLPGVHKDTPITISFNPTM